MSPRLVRAAVVVGVLVAGWAAWSWWSSPQRRLYRRLDALAGQLEKDGNESALAAAASAQGVLDFFAPGFLVRARPYEGELRDRQELAGAVMRLRGTARKLSIAISDRQATFGPGERTAELLYVAGVTLDRGGGPGRETWRVRSLWIEDRGEWRISELELLAPLEGGGGLLP
jgi:hypothetical protein